jgi:hypothetical protein
MRLRNSALENTERPASKGITRIKLESMSNIRDLSEEPDLNDVAQLFSRKTKHYESFNDEPSMDQIEFERTDENEFIHVQIVKVDANKMKEPEERKIKGLELNEDGRKIKVT